MNFFSPLEQFDIMPVVSLTYFGVDFSLSSTFFFLFLTFFFFSIYFFLTFYKAFLIPRSLQLIFESLYDFLINLFFQQLPFRSLAFFPFLASLFFFVLFLNYLALLPFGFSVTAHFIVTLSLSFSFNFSFLILAIIRHKLNFVKLFVPSNAPLWLMPLLIPIEILSYSLRPFSMAIRLFANMMAGHTLMYILSSFFLFCFVSEFFFFSFFGLLVVLAVLVLENLIAFIQAYIFFVLLTIYFKDVLHYSH
jgi:ATP synthase subunit 6